MNLKEWNLKQIEESKSDINKYFFWKKYGREGTDKELLLYYIENGGGMDFAEKHQGDSK